MDVVDEGPLDPRIQIELENLNTATDNINKLEIDLDEANTAFGQLLSEWSRRKEELVNKLGANCIERARFYYEALEVSRQARIQCQYQAKLFQRASEIHAAAKETVALAEARFMSHQHEWNFDQAWQDMINHATIKVMDAENQKAECAREHHRRAVLCHDAELKVQQLEEKYRKSIIKAQPYFEIRAQYDQMLATQKECVDRLKKGVKDAKRSYSLSFRALEDISNQIHEQRRDYDMVANGPREPGVGAELISSEDSLNYEAELNKVSISRFNSLASSTEPDAEERAKDFDDVQELQQRVEQLGNRSIDGSESISSQWELELQASLEKLNNLSIKNAKWENNETKENSEDNCNSSGNDIINESSRLEQENNPKSVKNDQNESKKLPMDFQILKKLSLTSSTSGDGRHSLTQSPINSILSRSKIAIRNSLSKSLSNSPVNMSFAFGRSRVDDAPRENENPAANLKTSESSIEEPKIETSSVDGSPSQMTDEASCENKNVQLSEESGQMSESKESEKIEKPEAIEGRKAIVESEKAVNLQEKVRSSPGFTSHSVDSTPARTKTRLSRTSGESLGDNKFVASCLTKNPTSKTSSVKELPLLALFRANEKSLMSKDKSCSMINLAEKQNLKSLLDNPDLRSIQTVSVERLANARNGIINEHSETQKMTKN